MAIDVRAKRIYDEADTGDGAFATPLFELDHPDRCGNQAVRSRFRELVGSILDDVYGRVKGG